MTYAAQEASLQNGQPVELYEFKQGVSTWRFANSEFAQTKGGQPFVPWEVKRSGVKTDTDIFKNSLTLQVPASDEFAQQFIGFSPDQTTTLTVYRGHTTDGATIDWSVYWKGRILRGSASGVTVSLECEPIYTSLQRPGLRAKFEYTCRHAVYDRGCTLDKETKRFAGNVSGNAADAGGLKVTVPGASALGATYFVGGMLIGPDNIARFIVAQTGDVLTLRRTYLESRSGDAVRLYPGCDGAFQTCIQKFNNLPNYGGFPWIPTRNPFDGSSIV